MEMSVTDEPPVDEPPTEEPPAEEPPAPEEPPPPPPVIHPPTGWTRISDNPVIRNDGQIIDPDLAEQLAGGGHWADHKAAHFIGTVWFYADRWFDRVAIANRPRATYWAPTLEELRQKVNDVYGWD